MSHDVGDEFASTEGTEGLDDAGASDDELGHEDPAPEPDEAPDLSAAVPREPVERTGNPVVDSVLDSLRELDELPVSEHVAVFEAAHDRLRGALADAGEPPAGS